MLFCRSRSPISSAIAEKRLTKVQAARLRGACRPSPPHSVCRGLSPGSLSAGEGVPVSLQPSPAPVTRGAAVTLPISTSRPAGFSLFSCGAGVGTATGTPLPLRERGRGEGFQPPIPASPPHPPSPTSPLRLPSRLCCSRIRAGPVIAAPAESTPARKPAPAAMRRQTRRWRSLVGTTGNDAGRPRCVRLRSVGTRRPRGATPPRSGGLQAGGRRRIRSVPRKPRQAVYLHLTPGIVPCPARQSAGGRSVAE